MGRSSQYACTICKEKFGSRYLGYLHVWVMHSSVPGTSVVNTIYSVAPLEEGRVRLYQTTADLMARATYDLCKRGAREQLYRESYEFLILWNRDAGSAGSISRQVARAHASIKRLLDLCTRLGLNEESVWSAVEEDTCYIIRVLKSLLTNSHGHSALTDLAKDPVNAESFVSLVNKIDKNKRYWSALCGVPNDVIPNFEQAEEGNKFRRKLLQASIKVAQLASVVPEALLISGVTLSDKQPTGGGTFADIYLGDYHGWQVAVKKLRTSMRDTPEGRMKQFCKEAMTWKLLDHPHILKFYGVSRELFPDTLCMISPFLPYGNLLQYIDSVGFVQSDVHRLLFEVASGLAYLHAHETRVAHGDLRCRNILIDDRRHARLCDFGFAALVDASGSAGSARSGATWTAPELNDPRAFGLTSARARTESDIFAFAGVCWEVYNSKPPFFDLRPGDAILRIARGERPPQRDSTRPIPNDLWDLMSKCWRHDYTTRPQASEVATACHACQRSARSLSSGCGNGNSIGNENAGSSRPVQVQVQEQDVRPPRPTAAVLQRVSSRTELSQRAAEKQPQRQSSSPGSGSGSGSGTGSGTDTRSRAKLRKAPPASTGSNAATSGSTPQNRDQNRAMSRSEPLRRPEPWTGIPYERKSPQRVTFGGVEMYSPPPSQSTSTSQTAESVHVRFGGVEMFSPASTPAGSSASSASSSTLDGSDKTMYPRAPEFMSEDGDSDTTEVADVRRRLDGVRISSSSGSNSQQRRGTLRSNTNTAQQQPVFDNTYSGQMLTGPVYPTQVPVPIPVQVPVPFPVPVVPVTYGAIALGQEYMYPCNGRCAWDARYCFAHTHDVGLTANLLAQEQA